MLTAAILHLYDAVTLPVRAVRTDERIGKLERDLAKLEGIVDTLAVSVDAEHRAMKENRQEDRLALKELAQRMERSVATLAEEMKKIAERNATIDNSVVAKQSQTTGAIEAAKYIIGTAIAAGALFMSYQAGVNKEYHPAPKQQSVMVAP
jgi:hypothetical protein